MSSNSLKLCEELEALLPSSSSSVSVLKLLIGKIKAANNSDYTRSRAIQLQSLTLQMQSLLKKASIPSSTYSDKAKALASVSDSYLKLVHAFKTDPKMWASAQTELVPQLSQVSDEKTIDEALCSLEIHLETYLKSLDFWLERSPSRL